MSGLYLRSAIFKELPEFTTRPFNEFLAYWHTEKHETKVIEMCGETLESLEIYDETNTNDHAPPEPCFPHLERVSVYYCDKLKYLFSITIFDILPKLYSLEIDNAYELEHVLIKQDEMEEIDMKDVLPQLEHLTLSNLPNLFVSAMGSIFKKKIILRKWIIVPTLGATKEIVEEDFMSEIAKMTISSSDSKLAGQLVDEARAKSVSSNTLYQISLTRKVSASTALPTRDNTHACAKIFEDEEQEQGCLITSRRLRSGTKASTLFWRISLKPLLMP
ncbi:hypothetical protein K1719_047578 [Acacia pycnantha]|nr:hypothetical protein K1719_047578 [Acacia pycnantha]